MAAAEELPKNSYRNNFFRMCRRDIQKEPFGGISIVGQDFEI
jgi:hypothetical protein